jgi:peptidyl-prolyl cis-trans isomerase A (cyclophilin A)
MRRDVVRRLATLALCVGAVTAAAQSPSPDPRLPIPGEVLVRIETALGNIEIAVDTKRAPITAGNFLKYVDGGFYDGGRFHRATRPDNYTPAPPDKPAMEIIQGGINPEKRRDAFPPIPLERTSVTGLKHVIGTVSMARTPQADSARSDFFICLDDQPSLDFGGRRFDDAQGGGAFGRVVKGMDVVRRIQQQPVAKDASTPSGTLTQRLDPPVTITRVARIQQEYQ